MKEIPLTHGQVALVDDEDYNLLRQHKWSARWSKTTKSYYAVGNQPQPKIFSRVFYKTILMHRVIMKTPKGVDCDHIDHDTLNNQKYNLRNVTHSRNMMNQITPHTNNKLGVLGVSLHKSGFRAGMQIERKRIHFPIRHTLEEAIEDRKNAEIKYHGEYHGNKK